jgi:DNA-binding LytR/AlgR family response regulator
LKTLTLFAVDDEPLALRRIRHIVAELEDVEIVGEALGCLDGLEMIGKLKPDILLLDIAMRDGTGFDFIDGLSPEDMPAIIFVTAFDHHAARAFEVSAVDFVLKPVNASRLGAAIGRARMRIASNCANQQIEEMRSVIANLRESMKERSPQRFETELWIRKTHGGFTRVSVHAIRWVEIEDDYIRVHTDQTSYLMRSSIKSLETRIDTTRFARIHRKALVRVDEIAELNSPAIGRLEVRLHSGHNLPVGRVYANNIRRLINRQQAQTTKPSAANC